MYCFSEEGKHHICYWRDSLNVLMIIHMLFEEVKHHISHWRDILWMYWWLYIMLFEEGNHKLLNMYYWREVSECGRDYITLLFKDTAHNELISFIYKSFDDQKEAWLVFLYFSNLLNQELRGLSMRVKRSICVKHSILRSLCKWQILGSRTNMLLFDAYQWMHWGAKWP